MEFVVSVIAYSVPVFKGFGIISFSFAAVVNHSKLVEVREMKKVLAVEIAVLKEFLISAVCFFKGIGIIHVLLIRRHKSFRPLFAASAVLAEKEVHRHPEKLRDVREYSDVRNGGSALPFAHRLERNAEPLGKLCLGNSALFPEFFNVRTDVFYIHQYHAFVFSEQHCFWLYSISRGGKWQ